MANDKTYRVGLELGTDGSAAMGLKTSAKAAETLSSKIRGTASAAESFGRSMFSSAVSTASAYGAVAAKLGAAGIAGAAALAASKGFSFLTSMEASRNAIGGTLQLFNHSAGATDQLGKNIQIAEASLQRLIVIANKSPGELQDVQMLFQNMLPGARAVTGDMERIMKLTQNAANMTPVFGGDFATTGSQIARMMTGGAGAEMETWQRLKLVMLESGKEMKKISGRGNIFGKNQDIKSLTEVFNKLEGMERLQLLEKALGSGGEELSKLYAESWEGASSTFVSGWRQIAAAGTKPMYETTKAALVRATSEGGVFDEQAVKRMQNAAASVGLHFAAMAERGYARIESAISYLDKNWEKVANTAYHAFQVGSGMIKAAFAFGFTKMTIGAGLMAAGMVSRGVGGAARGARAGVGAVRRGVGAVRSAAGFYRLVRDFGSFGTLAKSAASAVASFSLALLPIVAVGLAATAALGGFVVMVAGVGAYIASEWETLMGSVRAGFASGELTLRPLVEAAMLLWERLKLVGEALIGGSTGADMFSGTMNLAVGAIDMVSQAVIGLATVAAYMLDMAAAVSDRMSDPTGLAEKAQIERALSGTSWQDQIGMTPGKKAALESRLAELNTGTGGSKFRDMADKMRTASEKMGKLSLKDLPIEKVDDYTKKLEDSLLGGDAGGGKPKRARGTGVNIGTLNVNQDLRNEDPDRVMMTFVEPLEKLAKLPAASTLDLGGGGF